MRPEAVLVEEACQRLRRGGRAFVCCQVPLLGRSADLVYVTGKLITAVEFKLHDWRRAVLQARDYLLAADYAYVCMPPRRVTEPLKRELDKFGLGLCFYNDNGTWPFELVVRGVKSRDTWRVARSGLWKYIREHSAV